ncbi:MAG: Amt family ammonium transporter [Myxococcota bacterium]|jgi:Amt family ammonium transporter
MHASRLRSALAALTFFAVPSSAMAAIDPEVAVALDTLWVIVAGILVFFMNAGFGLLEAGMCRAKNAVNILAKNLVVASVAGIAFYFVGFALMFGDGNSFVGFSGFMLGGADNSPAMGDAYAGVFSALSWTGIPLEAKFFFQVCFAMAAASIVSGAVAERIKFPAFVLFAGLLVALVYPVVGHWVWGGGWLAEYGFWDFAGSTAVHSVGGWAALVGAVMLGARRGKYGKDGRVKPIPGHNLALATAGGFILWLGWFGFNAGSTMAADAVGIAHIATTTMMSSLAGILGALVANYTRTKTFDLTFMINGALAGLVGITASCAFVGTGSALIIGLIAGIVVVPAVVAFDRVRIDDPVGATSVHLVCGIWGTLAVGLFADAKFSADVGNGLFFGGGLSLLTAQAVGVAAIGAFVVTASAALWFAIDKTIGIRVDEEEEYLGLDIAEMGMGAYGGDPAHHGNVPTVGSMPPESAAATSTTAASATLAPAKG